MRGISIIIPTRNNLKYLKPAIRSIRDYTTVDYEILVYDDASTDGTTLWLKRQRGIKWVRGGEWRGIATGRNVMSGQAQYDYLFQSEDGFIMHPNWGENMLEWCEKLGKTLIVPSRIEEIYGENVEDFQLDEYLREAEKRGVNKTAQYAKEGVFSGHSNIVIRKSLWDQVGGMDTNLDPYAYQHQDLKLRLKNLYPDLKIARVHNVNVYHFISKSWIHLKNTPEWSNAVKKTEEYFKQKWGFEPGAQAFSYLWEDLPYVGWLTDRKWHQKLGLPINSFQTTCAYQHDYERCYKLNRGDCVVEVGAFWGKYGRFASLRVGEPGWVVLVEPNPTNIAVIEDLVKTLNLQNVALVKKAAHSKKGTMKLALYDRPENSKITREKVENYVDVETDTLDNIFEEHVAPQLRYVNLLAVDIPGAEGLKEVLKGVRTWISKKLVLNLAIHSPEEEIPVIKEDLLKQGYWIQASENGSPSHKLARNWRNIVYATQAYHDFVRKEHR